jgi:Fe-S cluster assembly scaffold protein SufB
MKTKLIELKNTFEISVEEDTQFVLVFPSFLDGAEYELSLIFNKPGVSAELLVPYKLNPGEKINLTTLSSHNVPNTSCITKVKGVLAGDSQSTYSGKIIIKKSGQQTKTFLKDNVLVLGDNIVNNSTPILQIDANDVQVSHVATTGRVREADLYYLMSRGLSKKDAEDLIIGGFLESLLHDIFDETVRKEVSNRYEC